MRYSSLVPAAGLALVLGMVRPLPAQDAAARRPNIVLFVVDDMGWMDSSVYGSEYYVTPHMERLAREGMTFTQAYAASPICTPTRASLMTGKHPARMRFTHGLNRTDAMPASVTMPEEFYPWSRSIGVPSLGYLPTSEVTVAEALRESGYRTGFVGKWHLGRTQELWPEHQGFEVNRGGGGFGSPPGGYHDPYRNPRLENREAGEYLTDRLTDEALAFVDAHETEPFFLCLWHYGVHGPWGHREELTATLRGREDPRGVQGNPIMASMLASVDESLGRVIGRLKERGLWEDTLLLLYSDNGGNVTSVLEGAPPTSNAPLRDGKASLYEGGIRVPLIVSWPGRIEAGARTEAIVTSTDFYPTLLEAAGLPPREEQHADGSSFAPVLRGERSAHREELFAHFPHHRTPSSALRQGDWKLLRFYEHASGAEADRYELYDLRTDPGETRDRFAEEPARARALVARLEARMRELDALVPARNPAYDPSARRPGAASGRDRAGALAFFERFDGDGDGSVTIEELGQGSESARSAALVEWFEQLDADADGNVTLVEVTAAIEARAEARQVREGSGDEDDGQ